MDKVKAANSQHLMVNYHLYYIVTYRVSISSTNSKKGLLAKIRETLKQVIGKEESVTMTRYVVIKCFFLLEL